MRLFVAIEIAPEIRERIVQFISQIKPALGDARWARKEGLHITLKFLGNVADETLRQIQDSLQKVRASSFPASVKGAGIFPNVKSPRVLWLGLEVPADLSNLAKQIDAALAPLGFEREKRVFTPHVTLARFKEGRKNPSVASALSSVPQAGFGTMTANQFHLYESKLSPQGSRYVKLATFALH